MRWPTPILLVWLGCALGLLTGKAGIAAQASSTSHARDYVRVADWAKAQGMNLTWLKRDEVFQLTKASWTFLFKVDTAEVRINGVAVWLSYPVLKASDGPRVSQLDLQTIVKPLISPPKTKLVRTICLDPGHGGKDPGNRVASNEEKRYTLLLAQEVSGLLAQAGLKVNLTRTRDTFVDLYARPEIARRRGSDVFVSLHFNSAATSRNTVQGSEVYCLTPAGASSTNSRGRASNADSGPGTAYLDRSILLAYQVQKALTGQLVVEDRGVRRARFVVLKEVPMPAILVEAAFMSHPAEGKRIFDPAYRRKMARAIADGILAYKRAVEQPRLAPRSAEFHSAYGSESLQNFN